jgi:eukaryotic-like serine/threonine-protein kinase
VILSLASKLVDAIDYLHNTLNIVHRDLKPQNILLDSHGEPKVIDFGKSVILGQESEDYTTSIEGTYLFLPPECCLHESNDPHSMKKADIWALGITLYGLTFNSFPFELAKTEYLQLEIIASFTHSFN